MAPDKRVRTGCATCRRRRVKCDEAKPICSRCRTANFLCEGYEPPRIAHGSSSSSSPKAGGSVITVATVRRSSSSDSDSSREGSPAFEMSWRHMNWQKEQLPLYHHFVTTTVVGLFRNDHVSFWRDQVAQMSFNSDLVYNALLAVGALHRASLHACQNTNLKEAAKFRVLGFQAYGNAIRMLPNHLGRKTAPEIFTVLVSLILLTYFECIIGYPKGAFRHLWAAIQLLRSSEGLFSNEEISNMVPIYNEMLNLDFQAQKLVPYARSSFLRVSNIAGMESPFWNRPALEFTGCQADSIGSERYRLIQLIGAHNKLSRVVWGNWCPEDERPSRDELFGFYAELLLWKANSPAIFGGCYALASIESIDFSDMASLPIPPPAYQFLSDEAAVTVAMFNGYLGCTLAMIMTTDEDPTIREHEIYRLVYQNFCIAAGLLESRNEGPGKRYSACDAVGCGISVPLFFGARRCYNRVWQQWNIEALRAIGCEGLSNGYTAANTIDIMRDLEASMDHNGTDLFKSEFDTDLLGPIRERLIPMLLPRGDSDRHLAFYLRHGTIELESDERILEVVAKASWEQDLTGNRFAVKVDVYDSIFSGYAWQANRPQIMDLMSSWRQETEKGWHGYLARDVQEGFLQKQSIL